MSNADDRGAAPKHGAVCWNELNVRDVERAKNFYSQSLGWDFEGMPMEGFTYFPSEDSPDMETAHAPIKS